MDEKRRVLVIDDEVAIRRYLRASLDPNEYEIFEAGTGEDGMRKAATERPAVILLDLGLPDIDGVEVAKRIREWSQVPIIVLSARGREVDKVMALDAGADDYLTKPFGSAELMARIRVTLRHAEKGQSTDAVIEGFGVKIDLSKRQVFKDGAEIHLTPNEYGLLAALARHAGRVVTHRHLLEQVWGPGFEDETHYLRVYMGQLRHKLEVDPVQPKLIANEPGVGYRLKLE